MEDGANQWLKTCIHQNPSLMRICFMNHYWGYNRRQGRTSKQSCGASSLVLNREALHLSNLYIAWLIIFQPAFQNIYYYSFSFLINLFIYLFMAELGLRCCARAFSTCSKWGLLFVAVHGLLIAVASLVAEHGL